MAEIRASSETCLRSSGEGRIVRISAYILVTFFLFVFFFLCTEPTLIAKSNIILDVKPWDDETDMAEMEKLVRSIEADGLLWGACKFT